MPSRRADIFFYGLFMDPDYLRARGLTPQEIELASAAGWALRIGHRAAVVRDPASTVQGVVMALTLDDIDRLYAEPGVAAYRPEPILTTLASGGVIAAICYNLPDPPSPADRDPDYTAKLIQAAKKMGLAADYIQTLTTLAG